MSNVNKMFLYEILRDSLKGSREERLVGLQRHNCLALRDYLRGVFDDSVIWLLPVDEEPPYTPCAKGKEYSSVHKETKRLSYFAKGGRSFGNIDPKMANLKREKMFISIIESINEKDAKLYIAMLRKATITTFKNKLTKALVTEAFPKLILK